MKASLRIFIAKNPMPRNIQIVVYILLLIGCCFPIITPSISLLAGIVVGVLGLNPFTQLSAKWGSTLLKACVVGLGFGINMTNLFAAGQKSFLLITVSVVSIFFMGLLLAKLLKIDKTTGLLIASGTAICGGSAIATIGSASNATTSQLSIATAIIFSLNAIALLIFPTLGRMLHFDDHQFGTFCAIAIHDTSSVVGAAKQFSEVALIEATTDKLVRVLWIIPLAFSVAFSQKKNGNKIKLPWFILLFITASIVYTMAEANAFTAFGTLKPLLELLYHIAKQGLVLCLFLIGSNISIGKFKEIGYKPFLQGIILWAFAIILAFTLIKFHILYT